VDLGADDLVHDHRFADRELGYGDHHRGALERRPAPAWDLWRRIAAKTRRSGARTCSARTFRDQVGIGDGDHAGCAHSGLHQKIAKRDPFSGKVVTGGIVSVRDSRWLMSWTVNRQPHFKNQPKDQIVVWVYSLFVDTPGDYVKKPMQDCTGEEITREWPPRRAGSDGTTMAPTARRPCR
jgi:oleate hydratase